MMTWSCGKCGRWIAAPDAMINQDVKCPKCGESSTVPVVQLALNPENELNVRPSLWAFEDQFVVIRTIALGVGVGGVITAIVLAILFNH